MKVLVVSLIVLTSSCSLLHKPVLVYNACQIDGTPSRPFWEVDLNYMYCPDGRLVKYETERK